MKKIVLPAHDIKLDTESGVDAIWYEKLRAIVDVLNGGTIGTGSLATSATSGFGYLPTMPGAPTGVPVVKAGYVPYVYDTSNNKLWVYNGAWKGVVLT
jgi:hypothetical protein